jgi:hypothetical protein
MERTLRALSMCFVIALLASGCEPGGTEQSPCSAATCSGCCQGNYCNTGPSAAACGHSGQACGACDSGEQCVNGRCEAANGACQAICDGCCTSSGQCVSIVNNFQCGANGGQCQACGSGKTCASGQCQAGSVDTPCTTGCKAANGACLGGESAGACGSAGGSCEICSPGEICKAGQCKAISAGASCDGCPSAGCCLDGASCEFGITDQACGKDGESCTACGTDEQCVAGECKAVAQGCNATNCSDGCCPADGGACVKYAAQSNNQCGGSAQTCNSCSALGNDYFCDTNSSHSCQKTPVANTCGPSCKGCCYNGQCMDGDQDNMCGGAGQSCTVCAGTFSCESQTCTEKPTLYRVKLTSVQMVSSWNAECGLIDDCDFYVKLTVGGQTYTSTTIEADGDSSTFDHSAWTNYTLVSNVFASDLNDGISLVVYDENVLVDVKVGSADIKIDSSMLNLGYGTFPVQKFGGDSASVNLAFEKIITN